MLKTPRDKTLVHFNFTAYTPNPPKKNQPENPISPILHSFPSFPSSPWPNHLPPSPPTRYPPEPWNFDLQRWPSLVKRSRQLQNDPPGASRPQHRHPTPNPWREMVMKLRDWTSGGWLMFCTKKIAVNILTIKHPNAPLAWLVFQPMNNKMNLLLQGFFGQRAKKSNKDFTPVQTSLCSLSNDHLLQIRHVFPGNKTPHPQVLGGGKVSEGHKFGKEHWDEGTPLDFWKPLPVFLSDTFTNSWSKSKWPIQRFKKKNSFQREWSDHRLSMHRLLTQSSFATGTSLDSINMTPGHLYPKTKKLEPKASWEVSPHTPKKRQHSQNQRFQF